MTSAAFGTDALAMPLAEPIDLAPDAVADLLPIAIVNASARICRWSSGCAALYGWSAADAVGRIKHDLLRSSAAGVPAAWPAATGGVLRHLDETCRDGRRIHVLEQVLPLGTPGYFALSMMQSKAAYDHSGDDAIRIETAPGTNAIGLCSDDVTEQRFEWSQLRWKSPAVESGNPSLDQMMSPLFEGVVTAWREASASGGDDFQLDVPVEDETLGVRALRVGARSARNGDFAFGRFIEEMQDPTDADIRKRALRDREAELSGILDTASDAMVVVDGDGAIGAFSRAAQELLGYDSAAMIGRPIAPLIEGGWPAILSAASYGSPREMSVIRAAGDRLPVDLRIGSLPGNTASGHILFFTDISERKAKEARRNLYEHAARDIAIAEFAVHLMHELNQPLAAASNFLAVARHLATESGRVADSSEMIDRALGQIQRLGGIIRSTQRKAIGEDIDPSLVAVRVAIDEAVALVHIVHGNSGIAICVDVHTDADTMVVDPTGLQQVLANLLRNAIEAFGPVPQPGARIDVRSRRSNRCLLLSVADNGPGIPPAAMADLFEPFRQIAEKNGMGLGLSICRTIAEAHGGTLSAENLPGGGACFTLALPPHEWGEAP